MFFTALTLVAMLLWAVVLLLPFKPWSTRERLEAEASESNRVKDLSDVVAIVPARNESRHIATTLKALRAQGRNLRILVVDDESEDETRAVVEALELKELTLIRGKPLTPGWSGKVWALAQAEALIERPLVLLLDADIRLARGVLPALKKKLEKERLSLVSLMAKLPTISIWEKLLVPAFVYFFKLLYPFALANAPGSRIAAAAGGCVLIKSSALEEIGGFTAIKDALIDDCALARLVKQRGHKIWLGLTTTACSARRYLKLADIWNMVARTAFTQLGYSLPMLLLCTVAMTLAFVVPVAGLFSDAGVAVSFSATAVALMMLSYLPTLKFYRLNLALGFTLPLAGALFLAMTLSSAIRYCNGERSFWHGRLYRV